MEGDSTVDTNLQKRVILLEALGGDDRNKITAKIFESEVYNDFPMGRLVSKENELKEKLLSDLEEALKVKKAELKTQEEKDQLAMEFAAQKKILESPEELDKLVSAASASDDSEKKKFTDFVTALDKLLTSEEEHQLRESMLVPGISSASPVSKPTIPEPPKEDAASKPLGEPDSLPKTVRTKARIDALLGVTDGDTAKKAKELTAAFNGLKLSEDAREALTGILPGRKVDFTDPRAVTKEVDQILETMGLPEYKSDKNPPDPQGEIVRNFTTLRLAMNTLGSPISKGGE